MARRTMRKPPFAKRTSQVGHMIGYARISRDDAAKRREIAESVLSGKKSGAEMARLYDVSQATASRIVAEHRIASLKSQARVRRSA